MMSNKSKTIMIVDLSVDPLRQAVFDDFYHNFYIPQFLEAVPEIITARRYAQINSLGKFDPGQAHFLTIYELLSDDAVNNIDAAITRPAHKEASDQFKIWKQDGLSYFDRAYYQETARMPRESENECWTKNFLYIIYWTTGSNVEEIFVQQLLQRFIDRFSTIGPKEFAGRAYLRKDSTPSSFLTVFEVADQDSLIEVIETISEDNALVDQMANTLVKKSELILQSIYSSPSS